MSVVRRENLDAFWSTASGTVDTNMKRIKRTLAFSRRLGLQGPYKHIGPFPSHDYCGYETAYQMLLNSLNKGRINPDFTQWNTIRHVRASFANQIMSSSQANRQILSLNDNSGSYQRLSHDPCGSLWFQKFGKGCHNRMGDEVRRNKALSTKLLKALIRKVEEKIRESIDREEEHRWIVFSCYVAVCYTVSLKGNEGFLFDLHGLIKYWDEGSSNHFIIALRGKIKGEKHDIPHLIPCADTTGTKNPIKQIVQRLIRHKKMFNLVSGPAIADHKGKTMTTRIIDELLHSILEDLFLEDSQLFTLDIRTKATNKEKDLSELIHNYYSCFRTFRRSSNSRTLEMGKVPKDDDIDVVNRWRTKENSKGKLSSMKMRQHYAEVELLLKPFLRYTRAM